MTKYDEKSKRKIDENHILFKSRLKAPKKEFRKYPVSDIPDKLDIYYQKYINGFQNIYLQSVIYHPDKPKVPLHWLVFDVESDEHHNILKNTGSAIDLLSFLNEKGLTDNLTISLTGWGYRFIYPYYVPAEYGKAFLELCSEFSKQGIDAGLNKDKKFVRLSGYRGNADQCRKKADVIDRHIHFMTDPLGIIFGILSEKDYLDRVNGKPDYNRDMNFISELLPTSPFPEKWTAFLETYLQKAIIRDSFWCGYPKQKGRLSREQLEDAVGDNLRSFIEKEEFDITATLRKCPECNRSGAFVTSSGRLKCWHTSCSAGERDTDGKIVGLPASDWNQELAEMFTDETDPDDEPAETFFVETKSIEVVREGISKAISSDKDYLINVMPGVGKTTTTLQAIVPFCMQHKLLYITPNHRLNGEIEETASELGISVKRLFGRNSVNCERFAACDYAAKKGYSVKFVMCMNCDRYREKNCMYYEQFRDDGKPCLWITTHAQAKFIDIQEINFKVAVIDENPIQAFFKTCVNFTDAIRFFRARGGNDAHRNFFDKIQKCADIALEQHLENKGNWQKHARLYLGQAPFGSKWENQPDLIEIAGILPEEIDAVSRNLGIYEKWEDESIVGWHQRLWKERIDMHALRWIWNCLEQNGTAYLKINCRRRNSNRYITYHKELPSFAGVRLVCLDATADKKDLDALLNRNFQVMDGQVSMPGLKTTWLRLGSGKTKMTRLSSDKIRKILKKAIPYLRETDQRVLLLTFKGISEQALKILQKLLPDRNIDVCHFGAGRGLNKWQNFDACICLGWLTVDFKGSLDLAQALHATEKERKAFHARLGKNEVLQGVHRIRPVFGNKNIILIANQWLSELGKPQVSKDCRSGHDEMFEEALKRCRLWIDRFGCLERSVIRALGICHGRDVEKATRNFDYFKRVQKEKRLGNFGNDTLLKFSKDETIYNKLVKAISEEYDLPLVEIKSESKWLKALGKIESFRQAYEFFGQNFDEEAIRECKNL